MKRPKPKVIFLDAVGTLFDVRGSVGEVYSQIANKHGVDVPGHVLERSFRESFKAAPPPIFPGVERSRLPAQEFEWWRAIVSQTFESAEALHQFVDFPLFFADLYSYFATAHPWVMHPDVRPSLDHWQRQGIQLGIISNFDSRLHLVLKALGLESYFSSITISSEISAAKPEPEIFAAALEKHGCQPEEAWHIGDSYDEDYYGAKAQGIHAIWLQRAVG